MWSQVVRLIAACAVVAPVLAQTPSTGGGPSNTSDPLAIYTISAEGITGKFIPYGARLISLLVPDRDGNEQDVAPGYDTGEEYVEDSANNHTFFGAVVGRYANRIKNGTFTIGENTYHIPQNENNGSDTLHGGKIGYDQRNWTVVSASSSSISFSLLDTGFEGFPGTVLTVATYSVGGYPSGPQGQIRPRLTCTLVSHALDEPTPIMLANHIYWNLNAFKEENTLNDTTLWMPYADRYIEVDPILIPTGAIGTVDTVPALDFTSPKLLADSIKGAQGLCGNNCTGVDNAFINDRPVGAGDTSNGYPVLSLWSKTTGIQMDVSTNQIGMQIYTCNGQKGNIAVKKSQQDRNNGTANAAKFVNKYGCMAIEPQVWIDGINNPEWGVTDLEIFSPETGPAVNYGTYDFSTF